MARAFSTPKATCGILALLLALSFQTADAQTDAPPVPGWGIALLVLASVLLLLLLILCCCMMCCRKTDSQSTQAGVSSYFPHLSFGRQEC